MKRKSLLVACVVLVIFTALSSVSLALANIPVKSISLNKTSITLTTGSSVSLTALISPKNATNKAVTWSSSNSGIAKVSSKGVVTAVKAGKVTITAKSANGKVSKCNITITVAQKVLLNYYGWSDEKSYADPVIAAFNAKNSDIQVKSNWMVADDFYTKILTMISANSSDLDLLSVNGLDKLNQYEQLSGLADLTNLIKTNNVDISKYGPSMEDLKVDGKYYCLPYRSSCYALFYNKDLFDKAGIPYPVNITWEQYAEIAKKLTSGSGDSKIWGGFIPDWMRAPLITTQRGTNVLDDNMAPITEWLTFLNRLYNVDKSHMSFAEMQSRKVDWLKIFESGTVAMLPNGEWTVGLLNADAKAGLHNVHWDVAPIPVIKKGDKVISLGGVSTYVSIYAKSKHIPQAFKFASFYTGDEGGQIIASTGMMPAYLSDPVKKSFITAAKVPGAGALLSAETYMEAPPVPQMAAVFQAYMDEKQLYMTEQETIDQFSKNFQKKRADALAGN